MPDFRRVLPYLLAALAAACLAPPEEHAPRLPVTGEDSAIEGYRVRSHFNLGGGREWRKVYGSGALEADTSVRFVPPLSLRITGTDTPSNIIETALSPPEDVCGDVNLSLRVRAPSRGCLAAIQSMAVSLIGGPDHSDSANYGFEHTLRDSHMVDPGRWTRLLAPVRAFRAAPGFDCRRVSRVRIRLSAREGFRDTLNLGELAFFPSPVPRALLVITEDDQWADFDSNGTPAMRKHGFPGTIYVNGGLVGAPNRMTLARLKALQDSGGWTIASHLWMHDTLTRLTDDSAVGGLRRNAAWLREQGFTGSGHFAYPFGQWDLRKDAVVRAHCATARLTVGWTEGEAMPPRDPYRLRVLGFLDAKVRLEQVVGAIRRLAANRTAGLLGVHQIVKDGALDERKWYRHDWEALLDEVRALVDAGALEVVSLEEYLRRSRGGSPR